MNKFTSPLKNVKVASPCSAEWDQMIGDERKRFCGSCQMNVYNLSGMTKNEAENLLIQSEGRLCVRFFKRADGTVLTNDCPVGWAAIKRRFSRISAAFAALIFGIAGGLGFNYFVNRPEKRQIVGTIPVSQLSGENTKRLPTPEQNAVGKIERSDPQPKDLVMGRVAINR